MKEIRLSVIIPCTRPKAVVQCLEGLAKQALRREIEVIVVGDVDGIDARHYRRLPTQML
jgi:hypothetical protein